MSDSRVESLRKSVGCLLEGVQPVVEGASHLHWSRDLPILPAIRRAILRRQYDSLEAVTYLVDARRWYAAVTLLRPACEERIWLAYLRVVETSVAEQLLLCVGQGEMSESLRAQDNYAGRTTTAQLGLLPYLRGLEVSDRQRRRQLSEIGQALGWPADSVKSGRLPSLRFLAKKTDNLSVYNFLYHATSRVVHFSPAELFRRAWGRPGDMSIRSTHFHDYWAAFALYWGLRLFMDTLMEYLEGEKQEEKEWESGVDQADFLAAAKAIGEGGAIPIITADELFWPIDSPQEPKQSAH
jgi:hypothetical protein